MDMQLYVKLMKTLGRLRQHERWTRAQVEAHQAESLSRLREFAYARSPFYQRFHKGLTDRPLQELPVLTKEGLMESFDELVTDRTIHLEDVRAHMANGLTGKRFLNRYWITATSGRTGTPGVFLFNRDEWAAVLANLGRVREWAGWATSMSHMLHRMPIALLASDNPCHMSMRIAETLNSLMGVWMPMRILDVSQQLGRTVQQLNDLQPHMLTGYASMMRVLADEQLDGRLRIHPHMIVSDSQVLTEEARECIKDAWGHVPFDAYWTTAGGNLAVETSDHTGLYVFEDTVILEVVDDRHRPVPPGVYGDKVLITVLSSGTQPLIRYELDDSLRLAADGDSHTLPFARVDGIRRPTG